MKRKLLALLLALAMLVGMLPASVFAAGTSSDGTAAVADEETTYTETSVNYDTYSWDTTCTGTNYGTMTGYYYKSGETYYQVYYIYSTESDNSSQTNNVITLYYNNGNQYVTISTTLYAYGPNSDNSVTLYYSASGGDSGDDGGDDDDTDDPSDTYNYNAELEAAAYRSNALVYWDIDHGGTDTDHSTDENSTYITSVTLGSTSTTDEDTGETTTKANSVTMFDTTDENFGDEDSNFTWDSESAGTSTVSLDDVYDTIDGYGNETDTATLTITPATGYYVTSVTIVCSAYVGEGSGDPQSDSFTVTYKRISPYSCATYSNDQAYESAFTLSNASGSALTLSVDISSLYFSHDGYTLTTYATNDSGETLYYQLNSDGTVNYDGTTTTENDYPVYKDDGVQAVYFILIEVAEIPTPAYVEYDFGEIVNYIQTEVGTDSSNYSAFSTASGWTATATTTTTSEDGTTTTVDKNTYNDTYSTTGGVLTDDTQYRYAYDKTNNTTGYNSWVHYTNSITEAAIAQAAAAGYVFAGWAVTYYSTAKATATSNSYNNYSISFSDASTNYTTLVLEDTSLTIIGNVRLVAQWVKADDISQVIDYGLPVSTDVLEEIEDDITLQALTSAVTSRSSVTQDLYGSYTSSDYVTLNTTASIAYEVTTTSTTTDDDGNETTSTSTSYNSTAEGTYGDFSVSTAGDAVYTLDTEMTGVESVTYQVTLKYTSGTGSSQTTITAAQPTGTLYIIPATSMYYEESFGASIGTYTWTSSGGGSVSNTVLTNGNLISYSMDAAFWVLTGKTGTTAQETGIVGTTNDSTYGADTYYLSSNNLGDSDGSSMYVDTSDYAASFTYTFTGTGTAIYTRTLDDSGTQEGAYIRVIIWKGDTEGTISSSDSDTTTTAEESSTGTVKAVGTWFIDTRIVDNVSSSSTLYNIPIFSNTDLDYGTYTVSVLVYAEGAPVQATYTTSSTDSSGSTLTQLQETETDDDGTSTTTYWYYQTDANRNVLYYTVDDEGNSTEGTDGEKTSTEETDYPVYYTSTRSGLTTATVDGETVYLTAVYVLADDTAGGDFYLDGIRIYNPLGTEGDNVSSDDKDDDTWEIASAAYEDDDEANNVVINIAQKLAADAEVGYTNTFVTLTDYYGTITSYDEDDTADHPDNEIYLDSAVTSTDDDGTSTTTTYSVSFYLADDSANDTLANYDVYLGLKAPDGTAGSVCINDTKVRINSSADCYYLLDDYLKDTTVSTIPVTNEDGSTTTLYGYKVTITGDSGLIALTYIKVTGTDEFDIAYSSDVETENEYSEDPDDGSTDGGTDSGTEATAVSTLYLLSAASVELEDEDDTTTDEDMLDDDSMAVDPDDDEDADSESDDTEEDEEDEDAVFEPGTFTASISYLKLLRYASITVKTSSDVSYITVNGTVVTGRSYGSSGTKTFSYTASRVSSGTTYEIIAYSSDGTASEPITLTAK